MVVAIRLNMSGELVIDKDSGGCHKIKYICSWRIDQTLKVRDHLQGLGFKGDGYELVPLAVGVCDGPR
jgi:hypothetical protein